MNAKTSEQLVLADESSPEHDSELPKGWQYVKLPAVAEMVMGQSPPSSTYNTDGRGLPFFQGKAEFGELYPRPVKFCDEPGKIAEPNDILITIRAPVGPTNLCEVRSCIGRGLAAIRTKGEVPPLYLLYFLRSIEDWLATKGTGSTFSAINKEDLSGIEVPVAPLAEQRRIVAKLDEVLGKVSSSQQRLARIPVLLKRFRQSVLAAACSGKLTADWREEHANEDQESLFIPDYDVPSIPSTWKWSTILEIGDVKSGKRLPKGRELVSENTGHLYLRAGNLKDGTVRCDGLLYVPRDVWPKIKNYTVVGGDVYITIVGACIGDAGVIPDHLSGANLTENAAKICNLRAIHSHYLSSWLRSQHCQTIIQQNILSAAQGKLALFRIQQLPVPVPPLPEQHEIVRRVEQLFAFADHIEARFKKAQAQVERLTQSVLAKAFRGELVPTEAELARREKRSYESASELLARIQAEKTPHPQPLSPKRGEESQTTKITSRKKRAATQK